MDFSFTDQTFAMSVALPYTMYDAERETWTYRAKECCEAFKYFFPKLQRAEKALGVS